MNHHSDWIWFWLSITIIITTILIRPIQMDQCPDKDLDCHWNEIILNCMDKQLPVQWKLNESIIHSKQMEQLEQNLPVCAKKMINYLYEIIFTNVDDRKQHCCYLWDFFDCISIDTCQQCGKKSGDIIGNAYREFQQNITTEYCSNYQSKSLKCHLLSLPFIGIIFIIASLVFAAVFAVMFH
ncbi:hypothetical protein DERP_011715 [Dermatophagoides pteronyssinus]|uniref:Transmembrane protein n=1 Tax=Dermatophagoides pteronyssinus TaxID=6956 RepID=A0ABQ8J376_DERPT|nr:hypothetical protein DERP_011715 [Dermatophagoides pteronyssinus]